MTVIEKIDEQVDTLMAQRKMPRIARLGEAAYAEYEALCRAAQVVPPFARPGQPAPVAPPPVRLPRLPVPTFLDKSLAPDAVVVE